MNDTPDRPYDPDQFFADFVQLISQAKKRGIDSATISREIRDFMDGFDRSRS